MAWRFFPGKVCGNRLRRVKLSNLIHIYAVCPSALVTERLTHYFGPQKGRFLDVFPNKRYKITKNWFSKDLTETEKKSLQEIILKLTNDGAICNLERNKSYKISNIKELFQKINSSPNITNGIVSDPNKVIPMPKSVMCVSDFESDNNFTLHPVQIEQNPTAFFDSIPNFIIQNSKTFTLIDPYIYEISPPKNTAENRLFFIKELIRNYFNTPSNENLSISIQVFGKVPKYYNKRVLKAHFANVRDLFHTNYNVTIDFYLIKRKNIINETLSEEVLKLHRKKVHERFFCADRFCFSFEDSSQDRSALNLDQTRRYEGDDGMRNFISCYSPKSPIFEIEGRFNSKQLALLSSTNDPSL